MFLTSMAVIGGDLRQCYLAEYMRNLGHDVVCFGTVPFPFFLSGLSPVSESLGDSVSQSRLVLGPVPFSKDGLHVNLAEGAPLLSFRQLFEALRPGQILIGGAIPKDFAAECAAAQITVMDLLKDDALARANAALTAEGLLASLITETPFSLRGRKVLLLGCGRCGQEILKLLAPFGMTFTVLDRREGALAFAEARQAAVLSPASLPGLTPDFDLVINTIPARVLTDAQLMLLPPHCVLFDIASAPFGFSTESTGTRKLVRCPGIPGKIMPKTAGETIGRVILERMLSYGL